MPNNPTFIEEIEKEFEELNLAFYASKGDMLRIKSFLRQSIERAYEEGKKAGEFEATPQYKKDMQDAYEKGEEDGRQETLKEVGEMAKDLWEMHEPSYTDLDNAYIDGLKSLTQKLSVMRKEK